ncbi:MAG: hypothetical protein JETT_1481 [Candidatus Jettenia ecosi]|uniref:Uncharacterized protein n=1 Tax=Candidatus Jettenia ecosi TaxID=2494326 RepID=A0A533QBZ6_9BACT|nr:MAG: hypothetical protein JETT_1481 [Candidatus Jettenia ecosi]
MLTRFNSEEDPFNLEKLKKGRDFSIFTLLKEGMEMSSPDVATTVAVSERY